MIIVKSDDELARMRISGRYAGRLRDEIARRIAPGVNTGELDEFAREWLIQHGVKSAFLGYRGFPGQICVSVNEEVVHGIPGERVIRLGDIVSIDIGVKAEGYIGDTATTIMVGVTDPDVVRLVESTQRALAAGMEKAVAGGRLSDISHAIESVALQAGHTVVREFVGHGIGRKMHEDPQIPNYGAPGRGPKLRKGMTLALEPMINMGRAEVEILKNEWTVATLDRRPSAHFEHTVAIRESGPPEVLTISEE